MNNQRDDVMLGGQEVFLQSSLETAGSVRAALDSIKATWPMLMCHDPVSGRDSNDISADATEILVFKDENAMRSWRDLGADESNRDTMIHLLADPNVVTLVVDTPTAPEIATIVESLRSRLHSPRTLTREDLASWVQAALHKLGGTATLTDVNRVIWEEHRRDIEASEGLLYKWQYEVRWAASILRKRGVMMPSDRTDRDKWRLVNGS